MLDDLLHVLDDFGLLLLDFGPSGTWSSDAVADRIVGKLVEFPYAMFNTLRAATEEPRNIGNAAVAEFHDFGRRISSAIFLRETVVDISHFPFHVCLIHFLELNCGRSK